MKTAPGNAIVNIHFGSPMNWDFYPRSRLLPSSL